MAFRQFPRPSPIKATAREAGRKRPRPNPRSLASDLSPTALSDVRALSSWEPSAVHAPKGNLDYRAMQRIGKPLDAERYAEERAYADAMAASEASAAAETAADRRAVAAARLQTDSLATQASGLSLYEHLSQEVKDLRRIRIEPMNGGRERPVVGALKLVAAADKGARPRRGADPRSASLRAIAAAIETDERGVQRKFVRDGAAGVGYDAAAAELRAHGAFDVDGDSLRALVRDTGGFDRVTYSQIYAPAFDAKYPGIGRTPPKGPGGRATNLSGAPAAKQSLFSPSLVRDPTAAHAALARWDPTAKQVDRPAWREKGLGMRRGARARPQDSIGGLLASHSEGTLSTLPGQRPRPVFRGPSDQRALAAESESGAGPRGGRAPGLAKGAGQSVFSAGAGAMLGW